MLPEGDSDGGGGKIVDIFTKKDYTLIRYSTAQQQAVLHEETSFVKRKMKKIWTIWKYAGGFSDKTEPYDNYVAMLHTIIVGVNFLA